MRRLKPLLNLMWILTIAIGLMQRVVHAQLPVSEREFLNRVNATHPASVALQRSTADAEGKLRAAGIWDNPAVWLEQESPENTATQSKIGVSWDLPFDGRRSMRKKAARSELDAANAALKLERLVLRNRMRADFAAWALAEARVRITSNALRTAQELAEYMDRRAASGEESRLASRRLLLATGELSAEQATAESELATATGLLSTWLVAIEPDSDPVLPDLPESPAQVLYEEHPRILASRSTVQRFEFEGRLAGRWLKSPAIDVGLVRIDEDSGENSGPLYGMSLDIPLFDRNQGDAKAAQLQLASARAQYTVDTVGVRAEWISARSSYERLRQTALSQGNLAGEADSVLLAASASFRAGETSVTDFLETLRAAQSSQMAAIELYGAALAAHRRMEIAAGKPLLEY